MVRKSNDVTCVVFFPSGQIEISQCSDLRSNRPPRAAEVKRLCCQNDLQLYDLHISECQLMYDGISQ